MCKEKKHVRKCEVIKMLEAIETEMKNNELHFGNTELKINDAVTMLEANGWVAEN